MNQIELNNLNKPLCEEAKIYWIPNKNYSSPLYERVMKMGNTYLCRSGAVLYIKQEGKTLASGIGMTDLLCKLAEMMR